ncbi:MAG: bifunctional nuclease family protein [Armatimonadetes bacterium]|nr:bifunctional nuclease family protein [Armatimonadota bacterium]
MADELEGPNGPSDDLNQPPAFFPYGSPEPEPEVESSTLVEVHIEGVFQAENSGSISHLVVLSDGERRLPIVIGPFEAFAILSPLENERPDRPMTHDLLKAIVDKLEVEVDRVVIDDLWSTTYYARIYLMTKTNEEIEIDARPSDAMALAVRSDAPIYVAERILQQPAEPG